MKPYSKPCALKGGYWKLFVTLLVLLGVSAARQAIGAPLANDDSTSVVILAQTGAENKILFTSNQMGFELTCPASISEGRDIRNQLDMLSKLGDPTGIITATIVEADDPSLGSIDLKVPELSCYDPAVRLYKVTDNSAAPEFYLNFGGEFNQKLFGVGCQGLLDIFGLNTNSATALPSSIVGPGNIFEQSSATDINCRAGETPLIQEAILVLSSTEIDVVSGSDLEPINLNIEGANENANVEFVVESNNCSLELGEDGRSVVGTLPEVEENTACNVRVLGFLDDVLVGSETLQVLVIAITADLNWLVDQEALRSQFVTVGEEISPITLTINNAEPGAVLDFELAVLTEEGCEFLNLEIVAGNVAKVRHQGGSLGDDTTDLVCKFRVRAASTNRVSPWLIGEVNLYQQGEVRPYNQERHEMCGVENYSVGNGEVCGLDNYVEGTGSVCGVKEYNSRRDPFCGIESYNAKRDEACGVERYNRKQDRDICGRTCPDCSHCSSGGSNASIRGCYTRCGRKPCSINSCRDPSFGVELYNSCRRESFGIEQYKLCQSETFGVLSYNTCRDETFGKIFKDCRHESFGVDEFQLCANARFGLLNTSNIAENSSVSSSSSISGDQTSASKAIDGNISGLAAQQSIAQTSFEDTPGLELGFEVPYEVSTITLWPKQDSCGALKCNLYLNGAIVEIYDYLDQVVARRKISGDAEFYELRLNQSLYVKKLKIFHNGTNKSLAIAEVQVWGS